MKIQVLGSGCATCKKLFELTKKAVSELNLKTEVEYITDIQKIVAMGLMQSPVLVVDDKPVLVGFTSDIKKIKGLINNTNTSNEPELPKKSECSCGGKC
jgi:small redox-active disulfide protein 2